MWEHRIGKAIWFDTGDPKFGEVLEVSNGQVRVRILNPVTGAEDLEVMSDSPVDFAAHALDVLKDPQLRSMIEQKKGERSEARIRHQTALNMLGELLESAGEVTGAMRDAYADIEQAASEHWTLTCRIESLLQGLGAGLDE